MTKKSLSIMTIEAVSDLVAFHSDMPTLMMLDRWDSLLNPKFQETSLAKALFD